MHQHRIAFEKIVAKGEFAGNKQILLLTHCFLHNQITVSPFVHVSDIISLFAAEWEEPKIGIWGKRLNVGNFSITSLQFLSHWLSISLLSSLVNIKSTGRTSTAQHWVTCSIISLATTLAWSAGWTWFFIPKPVGMLLTVEMNAVPLLPVYFGSKIARHFVSVRNRFGKPNV